MAREPSLLQTEQKQPSQPFLRGVLYPINSFHSPSLLPQVNVLPVVRTQGQDAVLQMGSLLQMSRVEDGWFIS